MANKLALDLATIGKICELVKLGVDVMPAARSLGVAQSTVSRYLKLGREAITKRDAGHRLKKSELVYVEFVERIEVASALLEKKLVLTLTGHFDKNPEAIYKYLARRFPERWGPLSSTTDETRDVSGVIVGLVAKISERVKELDNAGIEEVESVNTE